VPKNKTKSQHFVQRAYLEAFCDPEPNEKTGASFLWVHSEGREVRRQVPKECAVENYFYCHEKDGQRSFLGEEFLADLETASSLVLKEAQRGNLPITLRDRFTLTGYVAMALVRTPTGKKHIDQAAIDQTLEGIRSVLRDPVKHAEFCLKLEEETGKPHDPEEQLRILRSGRVRMVQTDRGWSLKQMAELMMEFQKLFMQMHLSVLHAGDGFFITCDCPVRVHNPATIPLLPKGYDAFDMLFPLSREFCLVGSHSKNVGRLELDREQVTKLNRAITRQAARFVYAPFDADYIQIELQRATARKRLSTRSDIIEF